MGVHGDRDGCTKRGSADYLRRMMVSGNEGDEVKWYRHQISFCMRSSRALSVLSGS